MDEIHKIITENRPELYQASVRCEERMDSVVRTNYHEAIEALPDDAWTLVSDALPELGVKVGLKLISGYKTTDKLILGDTYKADGSSSKISKWARNKNMEVEAWCPLPEIEQPINPIQAILDAHDISQSRKTTKKEAEPFHNLFDDEDEEVLDHNIVSPETVISALDDAINEMSYSNWHHEKFDTARKVVKSYCKEHNIPMDYRVCAPDKPD